MGWAGIFYEDYFSEKIWNIGLLGPKNCFFDVITTTVITQKIVALSFSTLVFLVGHSGLLDSSFYLCNIDLERIEGK